MPAAAAPHPVNPDSKRRAPGSAWQYQCNGQIRATSSVQHSSSTSGN
nr:MAG TPA_asm: hypothetical protein [Caudoviricetes sp.]